MPDPSSPTATVQRMFAAFGAADLDALIETIHPDSQWTYYGANPRLTRAQFNGQAAVRSFFRRILERLDMTEFNTDGLVVQGRESSRVLSEARPGAGPTSNPAIIGGGALRLGKIPGMGFPVRSGARPYDQVGELHASTPASTNDFPSVPGASQRRDSRIGEVGANSGGDPALARAAKESLTSERAGDLVGVVLRVSSGHGIRAQGERNR